MCWLQYRDPETDQIVRTKLMRTSKATKMMADLKAKYGMYFVVEKKMARDGRASIL